MISEPPRARYETPILLSVIMYCAERFVQTGRQTAWYRTASIVSCQKSTLNAKRHACAQEEPLRDNERHKTNRTGRQQYCSKVRNRAKHNAYNRSIARTAFVG